MRFPALFVSTLSLFFVASHLHGQVPDWPDLYDPSELHTLHVQTLYATDFDLIRADTTYDIEVPAYFWAEGENPIIVSIRRKSASAIPNELAPDKKVSFKIDINEYHDDPDGVDVCVGLLGITSGCFSKWKGVKKLSLENGDDQDVVQEGVAWYLHRLAAESVLAYDAGMASWVKLFINGQYQGVYVNVEQPDKQFLKNRGQWELDGDTRRTGQGVSTLRPAEPNPPTAARLLHLGALDRSDSAAHGGHLGAHSPPEPLTAGVLRCDLLPSVHDGKALAGKDRKASQTNRTSHSLHGMDGPTGG